MSFLPVVRRGLLGMFQCLPSHPFPILLPRPGHHCVHSLKTQGKKKTWENVNLCKLYPNWRALAFYKLCPKFCHRRPFVSSGMSNNLSTPLLQEQPREADLIWILELCSIFLLFEPLQLIIFPTLPCIPWKEFRVDGYMILQTLCFLPS